MTKATGRKKGGKRDGAGRPKGARNKVTTIMRKTLSLTALQYVEEAISTVREIYLDTTNPPSARLAAAVSLLDRACGKPRETSEQGLGLPLVEYGEGEQVPAMSTTEAARRLAYLLQNEAQKQLQKGETIQ